MTESDDQFMDETLHPLDAEILDELVESGFVSTAMRGDSPAEIEQRRAALTALFEMLDRCPAEDEGAGHDRELLVAATMLRIERETLREVRGAAEEEVVVPRRRFRIPDFVSVAAVLLIMVGVAVPVLQRVRVSSMDMACADNLRRSGGGFTLYAADFGGMMPTFTAGASRLFPGGYEGVDPMMLVEKGYCELGHLGCPGHHEGPTSRGGLYGHQMLLSGRAASWIAPVRLTVVLGDRSPLVDAFREGIEVAPKALSGSHGGRGQNVLQTDGSVRWLRMPLLDGRDNLWLPHGMERLTPGARPAAVDDAFLVH